MEDNNKNSRRKFLDKGLKVGLATALGGLAISKISKLSAKSNSNPEEFVELMTTDGTIIQVDPSEVQEINHSNTQEPTYNVREGMPNRKFVMVVDLARCKNALKCQSPRTQLLILCLPLANIAINLLVLQFALLMPPLKEKMVWF